MASAPRLCLPFSETAPDRQDDQARSVHACFDQRAMKASLMVDLTSNNAAGSSFNKVARVAKREMHPCPVLGLADFTEAVNRSGWPACGPQQCCQ